MNEAQTILNQLGGSQFIAMTGAKNFLSTDSGLQFDLPARIAAKGINKVRVTLTERDDYTVEFFKYRPRAMACDTVSTRDGVYCDALRAVFTTETGLDTRI